MCAVEFFNFLKFYSVQFFNIFWNPINLGLYAFLYSVQTGIGIIWWSGCLNVTRHLYHTWKNDHSHDGLLLINLIAFIGLRSLLQPWSSIEHYAGLSINELTGILSKTRGKYSVLRIHTNSKYRKAVITQLS